MPDWTIQHGNVAQVIFVSAVGERSAMNIRWYQLTADYAGDDSAEFLAETVVQEMAGQWNGCLQKEAFPAWVYCRRYHPTVGDYFARQVGPSLGSHFPGKLAPPNVAILVRLLGIGATGLKKGRIYIPWAPLLALNQHGVMVGAYETRLNNFAFKLVSALDTGVWGGNGIHLPVIWHRATSTTTELDDWEVVKKWASQRRRYDGNQPYPLPF